MVLDGNPALVKAALVNRVRTITAGRIELDAETIDSSIGGAIVNDRSRNTAFCHVGEPRGLGAALRWATKNEAQRLTVISESAVSGEIARRAALFEFDIEVWSADGPEVTLADPTPAITPPELTAGHRNYASLIAEAGARPIDDHGMLVAEVAGLEVARVVETEDSGLRLDVGVGQADRELQQYIHGHLDDDTNLRRAIAAVVRDRNPNSAAHPLSRLARQRWLRSTLLDDPSLIGLPSLEPVVPLRPRETLLGTEPVAASCEGVVVVCSVGVDLDLLPEAADYRNRDQPSADLVIIVPERDRPLVGEGVSALVPRLEVRSIEVPWEPRAIVSE